MKATFVALALLLSTSIFAQRYATREGFLAFDAGTSLEDIKAESNQATCIYDAETGQLGIKVLMTSFQFKRALMQEHFNENYVESEQFPYAEFKGKYIGGRAVGTLTMHGVSKDVDVLALLLSDANEAKLNAEFKVRPADFDIEIPGAVSDKINEEASIRVQCFMQPINR